MGKTGNQIAFTLCTLTPAGNGWRQAEDYPFTKPSVFPRFQMFIEHLFVVYAR